MTKGQKALKQVRDHWYTEEVSYEDEKIVIDNLNIIEKEVQALKIIINKNVVVSYLKESKSARDYNKLITCRYDGVKYSFCDAIKLTEKEHSLCKEVIKYGR